ncbi:MAG: hypothetical protein HYR84_09720, partial [Planctomycetes bacterium]|nr:hypothetical protein [Planctomycetota bacterium]
MNVPFPVRVAFLVLACTLFIGGFLLLTPPWPQPEAYHNFADQRPILGMPHMLNVWSNLPFLVVGVWGMIWMWRNPADGALPLTGLGSPSGTGAGSPQPFVQPAERWAYWLYFAGLALTGIGSSISSSLLGDNTVPYTENWNFNVQR